MKPHMKTKYLDYVKWLGVNTVFPKIWQTVLWWRASNWCKWPSQFKGFILINTQIVRFMGLHGAHLGTTEPRWAPCWPHEPCYQGAHIPWHPGSCPNSQLPHHDSNPVAYKTNWVVPGRRRSGKAPARTQTLYACWNLWTGVVQRCVEYWRIIPSGNMWTSSNILCHI